MSHRPRTLVALVLVAAVLALVVAGCGSTTTSGSPSPTGLTTADTTYLTDLTNAELTVAGALNALGGLGSLPLSKADMAKLDKAATTIKATYDAWVAKAAPSARLQAVHTLWMTALTSYTNGIQTIQATVKKAKLDKTALKQAIQQITTGQTAMSAMVKALDALQPSSSASPSP